MSRPFGTGHHPWTSLLLSPLAAVYGAIAGRRLQRKGFDTGIPVICVGNYHAGAPARHRPCELW